MAKHKTDAGVEKIFVMGAGAFGTALAIVLESNGHAVTLWAREEKTVKALVKNRENKAYLPGVKIPASIHITSDKEELLRPKDKKPYTLMLESVPTQHLRDVLVSFEVYYPKSLPVISASKGIEQKTMLRPTQIIRDVLGAKTPVAALSGPSHAEEVARRVPTSVVVSAHSERLARKIQKIFNTARFRVYFNTDLTGVEMGGALKNIIAIAAGVGDGLGLGDNAKSSLLTRGLVEMTRLGTAMGANRSTFWGLAGIGDLMTTCFSPFGRNRAVGERIGKGETLEEILRGRKQACEGVWTARAVQTLKKKYNVELPISDEVYKMLFQNKDPKLVLNDLMTRRSKAEIDK